MTLIDRLWRDRLWHDRLRRVARDLVQPASAHCDTEDGPVVTAGREALDTGNVNHALKWVQAGSEGEVRAAFAVAQATHGLDRLAAERRFLETLVRVHRAGEGAPFEGIAPAGTPQAPAVTAADRALAEGSLAPLEGLVPAERWSELAERFTAALALRDHDVDDLPAARDCVAAYVRFVHYAEGHDHEGHDHEGHDHEGHDHEGHDHHDQDKHHDHHDHAHHQH